MSQLKFDKNGVFIPQKIKFKIKRSELDEEFIEKYIENNCNFKIKYDNEANPIFVKKNRKGGKRK